MLKANKEISTLTSRLANPNFSDKAPPKVVSECRSKLLEAKAQADLVEKHLLGL